MNCPHCGEPIKVELNVTPEKIIETVCSYYGTTREVISRKVKYREIAFPRQVSFYFIKKYTNLNNRQAGQLFKKDPSTVIHSCEVLEDLMYTDKSIKNEVEEINNRLISAA